MSRIVLLALFGLLASWSTSLRAAEQSLEDAEPPSAAGALAPSFTAPGGELLLSWWEPSEVGHALRFTRWTGRRWSKPRSVVDTDAAFANWADTPSLAWSGDGSLVAWWPRRSGDAPYAYDVALARSTDGGRSWEDLGPAHDDGTQTEHGFVSMAPDRDGLRLIWLDGRTMPDGGAMQLRSAWLGDELGPSSVVDPRTCDCCGTDLVATDDGVLAVYRDRDEAELRDISAALSTSEGWTSPAVVHPDRWQIPGCPVNGPSAVRASDQIATAWTTVAGGVPRVKLAWSTDDGGSFGAPVEVDAPTDSTSPLGRVDLAPIGQDEVAVVWLQAEGDVGRVLLRRARADGLVGPALEVGTTTADRKSGFPRVALAGEELLVAWTDPRLEQSLRVRRVPLEVLPAASDAGDLPNASVPASGRAVTVLPVDFEAQDLSGVGRTLRGDHEGLVLVHLWASWCPPCLGELPLLSELAARHPDLRLVALAVDDDPSKVAAMVEQGQVPGIVLTASSSEVRAALGLDVLPSSLLFDANDLRVWSHEGALAGPNAELEALLGSTPSGSPEGP